MRPSKLGSRVTRALETRNVTSRCCGKLRNEGAVPSASMATTGPAGMNNDNPWG